MGLPTWWKNFAALNLESLLKDTFCGETLRQEVGQKNFCLWNIWHSWWRALHTHAHTHRTLQIPVTDRQ